MVINIVALAMAQYFIGAQQNNQEMYFVARLIKCAGPRAAGLNEQIKRGFRMAFSQLVWLFFKPDTEDRLW